jgi:type I restriction enzyme S subunit
MDSVMMVENKLKLDKSKWIPTKLGDLATEISKRVDNPSESEYDRFVGLGNFVSGDIRIKSWENTDNLASSAKAFEAGDILFARRNAYLRRASIVDFNGCCSGDAFVLREKHDEVVPGLLAFLLNSDALWDYANSNAAGTMSKRVKWRDLAEYQFLLPPKDQQGKLVNLLWNIDEVIEKENTVCKETIRLMNSFLKENITSLFYNKNQDFYRLNDICEIKGRVGWKGYKKTDLKDSGPIVIGAKDIDPFNRLSLINPTYLSLEKYEESPEIMVSRGDILIVQRGNTIGKLVLMLDKLDEVTINPSMVLMKNIKVDVNYLFAVLISPYIQKTVEAISSTTAIPMITQKDIKEFKIPKLSLSKMECLGSKIFQIRQLINVTEANISSSTSLQKSLINQVF